MDFIFNPARNTGFDTRHEDYWIIASENHPEVAKKGRLNRAKPEFFLWYQFEPHQAPETYLKYFNEKLGITSTGMGNQLLNRWNLTVQAGLPEIMHVFTIGSTIAALAMPQEPNKLMILTMNGPQQSNQQFTAAGRGGYVWNWLPIGTYEDNPASHSMLKDSLTLNANYRSLLINKMNAYSQAHQAD